MDPLTPIAACPEGLEWYTSPGTLGGYWRCKSTGKIYPGGPFAYPRTPAINGGATDMTGTGNNGAPPSEAWKDFVDTAQALLSSIQAGGRYNVAFDPYLSGLSVTPAAPPSQTINTWLLIGGGILLVLLLWR